MHMKILIIDDNPAVRATLKLVLADEFDQIAAVGDPRLIPAILSPGNIDAVLLDMNFAIQSSMAATACSGFPASRKAPMLRR